MYIFPEFNLSEKDLEEQKEKVLKHLEENKKKIEELLNLKEKSYLNFVKPYQLIHERLNWLFQPIAHLNYVKNSEATQKVYSELLPKITEYYTSLEQDERLYRAFKEVYEKEKESLNQEQKKVLENLIRDFELGGVGLDKEKRERLKEINIKLSQLQNQYAQNLLNATNQYELIIGDFEDVKELPETELEKAKVKREDGEVVYRFTLQQPSYIAYMTYGSNRKIREELYKAYTTRAPENEKLIEEILSLRDEKAKLLGFKNYAELSLKTKMAESPEEVIAFLKELAERSKPQGKREYEELNKFAKEKYGLDDDVQAYDLAYYSEKLKKQKYNVNDEVYKPYFEKKQTLEGLFKFLNRIKGIPTSKV